jgi:predicted ArsR family transcriptional regulator
MGDDADRRPATLEEARALAHPLRLRILRLCVDEALTNKELAARLGVPAGTALHHVRTLLAGGFLEEAEWRPGPRGTIEKPYRSTGKSWRLDVGGVDEGGEVRRSVLHAVEAEIDEAGSDAVLEWSRMAMRVRPDQRDELVRRLRDLIQDFGTLAEPGGEQLAMLVVLHRRAPAKAPPRRPAKKAPQTKG